VSQEFSAGFLITRRHGTASFSTRVSKFSAFTYLPGLSLYLLARQSWQYAQRALWCTCLMQRGTGTLWLHSRAGVSSRRTLVGWVGLTTALLQAVCRLFASASNANASNVNNE
jgi:hypothetical protein